MGNNMRVEVLLADGQTVDIYRADDALIINDTLQIVEKREDVPFGDFRPRLVTEGDGTVWSVVSLYAPGAWMRVLFPDVNEDGVPR